MDDNVTTPASTNNPWENSISTPDQLLAKFNARIAEEAAKTISIFASAITIALTRDLSKNLSGMNLGGVVTRNELTKAAGVEELSSYHIFEMKKQLEARGWRLKPEDSNGSFFIDRIPEEKK